MEGCSQTNIFMTGRHGALLQALAAQPGLAGFTADLILQQALLGLCYRFFPSSSSLSLNRPPWTAGGTQLAAVSPSRSPRYPVMLPAEA